MSVEVEVRPSPTGQAWPAKADLFGVQVSRVDYQQAVTAILRAAREGRGEVVSCHAVHALITASQDPVLRAHVNRFAMVTPDGQPVRWALNWLHGAGLAERVYGPELMLRVCHAAAAEAVPIYLYGGTTSVLETLQTNLQTKVPGLEIAGAETPPFRPLTDQERAAAVERIRQSGAKIVMIGLGCPKQDFFAAENRDHIQAVQMCVGAAFDFHAGVKPMAPLWMQRYGLEWLFRLKTEPRRLWRRYLATNSQFCAKLTVALIRRWSPVAGRSPGNVPGDQQGGPTRRDSGKENA